MISIQRSGGLGYIAYPQQYSCTAKMCHGIGNYDQLFRNLERFANQTAAHFGLPQVTPDGRIDAATARLVKQIVALMPGRFMFLGPVGDKTEIDFRYVAVNADAIMQALQMLPYTDPAPTAINPGKIMLADMISNFGGDPPIPGRGPWPLPKSLPDDGIPTISGRGGLGGWSDYVPNALNPWAPSAADSTPAVDTSATATDTSAAAQDQATADAWGQALTTGAAQGTADATGQKTGPSWWSQFWAGVSSPGGMAALATLAPKATAAPAPVKAPFPTVPVLLGAGALGAVFLLTRKKSAAKTISGLLGLGRSRRHSRRRSR